MQSPGARLRAYLVDGVRELWVRPAAQVPALDALRTLAIALVIATHVATRWTDSESLPISLTQHPFFYWGWTGVDLFFVLSGYLIGKQLWREFSRTGDIRIGRFLLRRGLRIWPLYYFFLFFPVLFGAPLLARWKDVVFLSNYLFLPGFMPGGWSLSTEEQFYILIPCLIVLLRKRLSLRGWIFLLLGMIGIVIAMRQMTDTMLTARGWTQQQIGSRMTYNFHLRSEPLFTGLLIALASVLAPAKFKDRRGFSVPGAVILVASAAAAVFVRQLDGHVFAFTAASLAYGSMTLFGLWDASLFTKPLHARIFYTLSRLSYGIYLNHFYFVAAMTIPLVRFALRAHVSGNVAMLFAYFTIFATCALCATVTFLAIERPFLLLREKLMDKRIDALHTAPLAPDAIIA